VQEIVANFLDRIAGGIAVPFTSPHAVLIADGREPRMKKAWVECRLVDVAIELPRVRERMHLLTAWTPVHMAIFSFSKESRYLHYPAVDVGSSLVTKMPLKLAENVTGARAVMFQLSVSNTTF